LLVRHPDDAAFRLERVELSILAGERSEALNNLARVRRLRALTAEQNGRIVALYRRLKAYRLAGEVSDALLHDRPDDGEIVFERAQLAAEAGERGKALVFLARAAELSPAEMDAGGEQRRRIAGLYRDIGEFGRANDILLELLRSRPKDAELWFDLAALETSSGEKKKALASLARAKELSAGDADHDGERRRRVALGYQALGEYGRALALFDGLARRYPTQAMFLSDRGLCEYLKGDADAAAVSLRKALKLDAKFLPAYLTLGAIETRRGRRAEALRLYEEGLALSPASEHFPLREVLMEERQALLSGKPEAR